MRIILIVIVTYCFAEFSEWKPEVEANDIVNYVLARGKRTKSEKVLIYICNSTGKQHNAGTILISSCMNANICLGKSRGKQICTKTQHRTKSQGSCKINTSCISEIKILKKKIK